MPSASIIALDNEADDIFELSAATHSHCFQRCSHPQFIPGFKLATPVTYIIHLSRLADGSQKCFDASSGMGIPSTKQGVVSRWCPELLLIIIKVGNITNGFRSCQY